MSVPAEHKLTERQQAAFKSLSKLGSQPKATGLGNNYYTLPGGAKDVQDLIEYKNMSFSLGNIFKACYRFGDKPGVDRLYDAQKIKWFAERIIAEIEKELVHDDRDIPKQKEYPALDYGSGG